MEKTTICAISTPAGVGGIAVIRVSGPEAIDITQRLWKGADLRNAATHTAHLGTLYDPATGAPLDQAVATVFRAPRSFTGEDVVELGVHGSIWIQRQLLTLLIQAGATLAEPGEFTRRAFANGKLDLAQVEAVADVIAATSQAAHRVALSQLRGNFSNRLALLRESLLELAALLELELDFSEEDVEFASRQKLLEIASNTYEEVKRLASTFATGDTIRRGIPVAIIGHPNVGKSSLLNRLIGDHRAIVSDIAGTTRDTIEETIDIDGQTYRFIDTAGLRDTADTIENLGIERAWEKVSQAKIILYLTEPNSDPTRDNALFQQVCQQASDDASIIRITNKADLLGDPFNTLPAEHACNPTKQLNADTDQRLQYSSLNISAMTGKGIDRLINCLKEITRAAQPEGSDSNDAVIITNVRHFDSLRSAATSLQRVIDGLRADLSGDFIAQDLREALHHLSAITGAITTPEILATIFSRFCIGK